MPTTEITLRDLDQLLRQKGFVAGPRVGNSRRYGHQRTGAIILLPGGDAERILDLSIANVRTDLDRFGLMAAGDFDEWIERRALRRTDGTDAELDRKRTASNRHGANGMTKTSTRKLRFAAARRKASRQTG